MRKKRTEVVRTLRAEVVKMRRAEKAGQKKKDGKRKSVQQKEGKRVSGEGLSGGKMVKDNEKRKRLWIRRRKMAGGRVCNKREVNG